VSTLAVHFEHGSQGSDGIWRQLLPEQLNKVVNGFLRDVISIIDDPKLAEKVALRQLSDRRSTSC
jgi:hypothetical protein